MTLRGRPLLNLVVREVDLDAALGGMVSAVELFQIPSPDSDIQSLIHFRDKVRYILGQLPLGERPNDCMMSKWLFERLKKVRQLQLTIDRIRESAAGSDERTYDYLWNRLERIIAESQHEKNLSSIQEGLKKGPKKLATPGNPSDSKNTKGKKGKGADGKSKGKGKDSKGQGKSKSSGSGQGGSGSNDTKNSNGKGKSDNQAGQNTAKKDGVCLFYPKGLCRRGENSPYRHEGSPSAPSSSLGGQPPNPKAKAAPAAPKASVATAAVAIVTASQVLGTAASIRSSQYEGGSFALEWALDSGAGEDLSSVGAFANQGVPQDWVEGFSTVSSSPLTFETGGVAKTSTNTVGFVGDKAGEGMVYLLKNCPYVRCLNKLIQKGYSFFWGPEHEPTLVPPDVPFNVSCETSRCFTADRVEHCVPIFKETISFTYGMPAETVEASPVDPRLREDGTEDQRLRGSDPILVEDVAEEAPSLDEMRKEM